MNLSIPNFRKFLEKLNLQFSARRFLLLALLVIFIPQLVIVLLNYYVDPFQYFHKSWLSDEPYYTNNQMYRNPGLIRNQEFETIVVGDSMTENYSTEEIDAKFQTKSLKLSSSGSTLSEQRMLIEMAARTGKLKRVIWSVSSSRGTQPHDLLKLKNKEFPIYLYNQNPLDDLNYLYNIDTTTDSLFLIKGEKPGELWNQDLVEMDRWYSRSEFSAAKIRQDIQENADDPTKIERTEKSIARDPGPKFMKLIHDNVDLNIAPTIANHPDVEFIIYFAPYSLAYQYDIYNYERGSMIHEIYYKELIAEKLANYENVQIFDPQYELNIIANLDNYKDYVHHNEKINSKLLDAFLNDQYLYDPEISVQKREKVIAEFEEIEELINSQEIASD